MNMRGFSFRATTLLIAGGACLVALFTSALVGCGDKEACVDKSKPALDECRKEKDQLLSENITLKTKLAQALQNPGTIQVDPELLTINGKAIKPTYKEGTLSQDQVIDTWNKNKSVLRACYERAMKKNSSLTMQKITLTIGFSVRPTGSASNIRISPRYDNMMNDCMEKAIRRWDFPKFSGQPVGVELPLTLVPRK